MKNQRLVVLLFFATFLFACNKEATDLQPNTDVTVTYRLLVRGEATLDEVRFQDENGQLQSVPAPTPDWTYQMVVPEGFVARMELLGSLPEGYTNSVMTIIDGVGYGSWGANFLHKVPGYFHLESEYQMGGD